MHELGLVYVKSDSITRTLLGLAVLLLVALLAGKLFDRLGQPPVIGEVIAGIALGPSVLGHLSTTLFPVGGRPLLKILSTIGLVSFMFLIGLDLDLTQLRKGRHRIAGGVAAAGTVVPFGLGLLLAMALYPTHKLVAFVPFAAFIGASMSITAFPVLARIMMERDLYSKPLGALTMACAAGDDVLTWITLAVVVAIISATGSWDLPYICAVGTAFALVMVGLVGPFLKRFADRPLDSRTITLAVVGIFLCSYFTSAIGIHEIFGAFLLGAIFPRGRLADHVKDRVSSIAFILLPVFFVTTGLNVDVAALGATWVWQLPLILVVACAGKFIGTLLGSRPLGLSMRESVALGVLMNTRGLTELVVLTIGLEKGVIDEKLFTLLVIMAVVTTVATAPLLRLVKPDPYLGERAPRTPEGIGGLEAETGGPRTTPVRDDVLGLTAPERASSPGDRREPDPLPG